MSERVDVVCPDYEQLAKTGEYSPKIETIKFIEFIKHFAEEKNKSALIHYLMVDALMSEQPYNVLQASRGVGKTTISEYFAIYCALFPDDIPGITEKLEYVLYLGDAEDNGVKQYIENVYLKIIGNEKIDALVTVDKKVKNELVLSINGNKFWIVGRGAKQSPRGTKRGKRGEVRPQLLIADDITNEDDAKSEVERETIKTRFNLAFLPALDPNGHKVILIGTPQHEDDIVLTKMRNKEWNRVKLPIANEFSSTLRKKDFVGAWPDRFGYNAIMNIYKQYDGDDNISGFMQEYMLELMDEADRMFKDEDFTMYKYMDVRKKLDNLNYYISCDFNASVGKDSDYGVLMVIGVTNNNDWLVVDGLHSKTHTQAEWIDELFRLVKIYDPLEVASEEIAFQSSLNQWIKQEMMRRNEYFNFIKLKDNNNKKKINRIATLSPRFHMKKIQFPEDHVTDFISELTHEMKMTTKKEVKARRDDLIDCLSNYTQMTMTAPGKNETYSFEEGHFIDEYEGIGSDPCIF